MKNCTTCNADMLEGFCIEGTCEYYCSAKCIDEKYPNTSAELNAMTDEELDQSETYWTSWDEDDTVEDEDESSSMAISYEDIVRAAEAKPVVNKYFYNDHEDGKYFEDGE